MTRTNATDHLSNRRRSVGDARHLRLAAGPDPSSGPPPDRRPDDVTIRYATPADDRALRDLAGLDSRRPLVGACLIAVVDGRVLAARALGTGEAIADPFHPTANLLDLLRERAAGLDGHVAPPRRGVRALFGSLAGRPHHLGARLS